MAGDSEDLDKLFESVADGESVDWDALERQAPDEQARALIRQLRLIADVAEVHRSQVDEVALAEDVELTAPSMGAGHPPIQAPGGRRVWPDLGTTPGGVGRGTPPAGSPPAPNLGVWGHLLLVRKVGEGSFGEVYHAHDTWLDHAVALKLLKPEAEKWLPPAQLLHEARKLARVRHPNVVTVHGADRHNGRVGFWMDFIDGETLSARVQGGSLSAGEASYIGQEVCKALAAVHRANLIHRDVKAQNVMRAFDGGRIILMDFGAGQFADAPPLENPGQGTPLYLAPEILNGGEATSRSDTYACGVLLFYLVTNRFPVNGTSLQELREAHARGDRRRLRDERPDLPGSFISIVERAIDPDPMRRYATAGDMEAKLSGEPSSRPVPAPVVPPPHPGPTGWTYAKRTAAISAALIAFVALLGFTSARAFEVFLRIDPDFYVGLGSVFTLGIQALFPFVAIWVLSATILAVIAGIGLLLPASLKGLLNRLAAGVRAWNPAGIAAAVLLAGGALELALLWRYWDVFAVLWAFRQDPLLPFTSMTLLEPASRPIHQYHGVYSAVLSFALGLAIWRLFPKLEENHADASTLRVMKWATLGLAILIVAVVVAPRRVIWDSFAVVTFDNHTALVIGTTQDELLLYAPDEPGRPRFRVRRDAPGLRLTGETRALFARSRPAS
jgi:protein kinase-like protein